MVRIDGPTLVERSKNGKLTGGGVKQPSDSCSHVSKKSVSCAECGRKFDMITIFLMHECWRDLMDQVPNGSKVTVYIGCS